jgi:hypothetical protein
MPPEVGRPLPRAPDAYARPEKWTGWIVADDGHGPDWLRVFDEVDPDTVWPALADALLHAQVDTIRPAFAGSVLCRVDMSLTFNNRTATVRTIWHYADEDAAPRLVTAFPTT